MPLKNNTGLDELLKLQQQQADRQRQQAAATFSNRLCGLLQSIPGYSDTQQFCRELLQMELEQQKDAIRQRYGEVCLQRAEPLLLQLHLAQQPGT